MGSADIKMGLVLCTQVVSSCSGGKAPAATFSLTISTDLELPDFRLKKKKKVIKQLNLGVILLAK